MLFPDTKLTKDVVEFVFGGDFAGDVAEEGEAAADVEGEEVAGEEVVDAGPDVVEGGEDFAQGSEVAQVGDDGAFCLHYAAGYEVIQVFL